MKISFYFDEKSPQEIDLPVKTLNSKQRLKHSFKVFGYFLGAAIVSVFIPILHFILVPTLIILAFIFSIKKFKQIGSLDISQFKCPNCEHFFNDKTIPIHASNTTLSVYCFNCRKNILFVINETSLNAATTTN